jgi:serine/threonine-protein kinase HipA
MEERTIFRLAVVVLVIRFTSFLTLLIPLFSYTAFSIGKFPSIADERAVTKGEVLALTLARKAWITAATARIFQSEDLPVALIRRFDRQGNGDRIMYVSAATMLGVEATEPEEHTYAEES